MLTLVARHRSDLDSGENLGMDEPLQDGELLIFKGTAGRLSQLQKTPGLGLATKEIEKLSFARTKDKAKSSNSLSKRRHRRMVEAVVGVNSPLVGKTVKEVAFRQQFNAVIIARRHGVLPGFRTSVATSSSPSRRTLSRDIDGARQSLGGGLLSDELNAVADVEDGGVTATNKGKTNNVCLDSKNCDCNTSWSKTRFCPGDSLLLVASTGFAKQFSSNSRFFALATEIADSKPPRQDSAKDIGRAAITWVMLAAIIGVSAVNDEYLLEMCCITISVQIYLKIMTLDEAWGAVKSSTLLTIAASFSLGTAIQKSGLAEDIADLIGKVAGPFGHIGLIAVVGFVTSLLSIMVSNTAVVIFLVRFPSKSNTPTSHLLTPPPRTVRPGRRGRQERKHGPPAPSLRAHDRVQCRLRDPHLLPDQPHGLRARRIRLQRLLEVRRPPADYLMGVLDAGHLCDMGLVTSSDRL